MHASRSHEKGKMGGGGGWLLLLFQGGNGCFLRFMSFFFTPVKYLFVPFSHLCVLGAFRGFIMGFGSGRGVECSLDWAVLCFYLLLYEERSGGVVNVVVMGRMKPASPPWI